MPSLLEKLANETARDVMPSEPQTDGEKSLDLMTIITVIITVFQTITQNCPKPPAQIAESMKKPGLRQRAALLKATKETCDCCGIGRFTGQVHRAMLAKGSNLSEPDALALVNEASNDSNLLI